MNPLRHLLGLAALLTLLVALTWAGDASAQSISLDLGGKAGGSMTGQIVRLVALITILSIAPSVLVMVTSFTRIVIVLSVLRTAIGLQQSPPNAVLIGISLFLTTFVMAPTLQKSWDEGISPMIQEKLDEPTALARAIAPFHDFMTHQVRDKDLQLFFDIAKLDPPASIAETPLRVLVPAFMISELRRAFEIGFVVFLPFLIIDLVISSILMAMGMMMLPPVMISLPFKLIFFVLVDGWYLVVGSLVQSFGPV